MKKRNPKQLAKECLDLADSLELNAQAMLGSVDIYYNSLITVFNFSNDLAVVHILRVIGDLLKQDQTVMASNIASRLLTIGKVKLSQETIDLLNYISRL